MENAEKEPDTNVDAWGFYIDKGEKIAILSNVFKKMLKEGGFQDKAFLGWAKSRNLIDSDETENRNMKQIRWKGKKLRMVVLKVQTEIEVDTETGFVNIPDDIDNDIPFE